MILFLVILGLLFYLAERYSMDHVLDGLELETSLDRLLVEPGEEFSWTMTVENRKRLMVPYLKMREQVPHGICLEGMEGNKENIATQGLQTILYLSGNQKAELARKASFSKRGRYFFRGSSVEAGDFLGFQTVLASYTELKEIIVKPKPFPHGELELLLGGYLGEYAVKKSLFEDPILTLGFREYTGREPFRAISWTQSAKLGKLLVKEQECTTDLSCSVLLNTECVMEEGASALLERSFSLVRSICEELEKKQIPYDFKTNGVIAGAMGNWRQVGAGLGAGHLETVLEGLGRMTCECGDRAEIFYERVLKGTSAGQSFLLVAPERSEKTDWALKALEERSGRKVFFVCAKEMGE